LTWNVMLTVGSSTDSGGRASAAAGSHSVSEILSASIPVDQGSVLTWGSSQILIYGVSEHDLGFFDIVMDQTWT
jgi:hypothetical protein